MSAGSIAVVAILFALVGLALWRNIRKGAPCSCGCSGADCCCGSCACGETDEASAAPGDDAKKPSCANHAVVV